MKRRKSNHRYTVEGTGYWFEHSDGSKTSSRRCYTKRKAVRIALRLLSKEGVKEAEVHKMWRPRHKRWRNKGWRIKTRVYWLKETNESSKS